MNEFNFRVQIGKCENGQEVPCRCGGTRRGRQHYERWIQAELAMMRAEELAQPVPALPAQGTGDLFGPYR